MKSYNYNAVVYDGEVYCNECLPNKIDIESEEVSLIFADQEWDFIPTCCVCGEKHDYISLMIYRGMCECCDSGCPIHEGEGQCNNIGAVLVFRIDMDDETGTLMCEGCADDALESGLFVAEEC